MDTYADCNCDYEYKQVPTGGRGGLGNIRARKKSKASSSENELTNSTSPSSFRFRLPSFENPRRSSVASGSTVSGSSNGSVYSSNSSHSTDAASITAVSGSNRTISRSSSDSGSISTMSPSPSEIAPCIPLSASRSIAFPSHPGDASDFNLEPGLPLPGSSSSTSPSVTTSPSSVGSGKTRSKSQTQTSTSTDYVLHLETDARQRALEKRLARAREREARLLSGVSPKSPARTDGGLEEGGEVENTEDKSVVRIGRGGAGVYNKIDGKVNPALHPQSADITRVYEERFVEVERTLIAASRARAAMRGSTGRGGSGNISGMDGKGKIFGKGKGKGKKGKGKAKEHREVLNNGASIDEAGNGVGPVAYEDDDETTLALADTDGRSNVTMDRSRNGSANGDERGQRSPGLRGLWRRVRRDGTLPRSQHSPSLSLDDATPRPSFGDELLHIGRASSSYMPSGTTYSASSTSSPPHTSTNDSYEESHSRTPQPKNGGEGAALLAFVNSALPDLPRNVLGVPGTPGFPLSGRIRRSPSGPTRPYNAMAPSITTGARVLSSVPERAGRDKSSTPTPMLPNSMEGLRIDDEEEWIDDRTLREADDDTLREVDEEEDEDSDIDPQILPSITKFKKQERDAFRFDNKRPDSLDAIISVALDKLDRIEDRRNESCDAEEEDIINPHAFAERPSRRNAGYDPNSDPRVRLSTHSTHSTLSTLSSRPPSEIGEIQRGRLANVAPPVLIAAPRYVRTSAPMVSARLNSFNGTAKTRNAVPVAWPPPAGPVPALPEHR